MSTKKLLELVRARRARLRGPGIEYTVEDRLRADWDHLTGSSRGQGVDHKIDASRLSDRSRKLAAVSFFESHDNIGIFRRLGSDFDHVLFRAVRHRFVFRFAHADQRRIASCCRPRHAGGRR